MAIYTLENVITFTKKQHVYTRCKTRYSSLATRQNMPPNPKPTQPSTPF